MTEIEAEAGTRDSFFTNADGQKIFCRYWCEDLKDPTALVMIVHGAGEHCLLYKPLALLLKEAGFYVFAHDHVGHGQSEGDRMQVDDFHDYVRDSFDHFDAVAMEFPQLPKFVVGHSLGGAVTITAAIERPDYFSGVVLIAPAVTVSPLTALLGTVLARIFPWAPVMYINPDHLSRDKAVGLRIQDDPLVYHGALKARWVGAYIKGAEFIDANMEGLRCPVLVMHGTEDKLTDPDGSRTLINRASSTDKTLKMYEGYYHQLHNEPGEDGAGVRREIVDWIASRVR